MTENISPEIKQSEIRHIAIEGVIGAGKTGLAKRLAEILNGKMILEEFENNPFLEKFYEEPERYAFQAQIFFLLSRYKQLRELYQVDLFHQYLITDYIFEKDKIFAYLNLADDELKLYETLAASMEHSVPSPDLVVYIQCSVERLMENIKKRSRDVERKISEEYVKELNEAYNYFFFRFKGAPLLIVNASQIDFINNNEHFDDLVKEIFRPNKAPVEYYNPFK
ncbi:MAG: deoxynucleoside kinase [Bacteroidota bacterium]